MIIHLGSEYDEKVTNILGNEKGISKEKAPKMSLTFIYSFIILWLTQNKNKNIIVLYSCFLVDSSLGRIVIAWDLK